MAKSQETYNKKEKEKKRLLKRKAKEEKRIERKSQPKGDGSLESMMAYVDENGYLTDTPPDPSKKIKIKAENIELGVPKREQEDVNPIKIGKVEFYNDAKGYGFIREIETQEKYFVHANGLLEQIQEGNAVTFELENGMKGLNAVRVSLVKK